MATLPVSYPLDLDGNAPSNLVRDELQVLVQQNDTPYRFFIPTFAPFYLTNLKLTGVDPLGNTIELYDGIHYFPSLIFKAASWSTGSLVFAAITMVDNQIQGPIYMTYQTIGGKYAADRNFVVERIAEHNYNPRELSWDQLTNIQEQFPPTPHPQPIDTFTGFRDLIDSVYAVRDVIPQQPGPNNVIWKHILDLNDPHLTLRLIPSIDGFATKKDVADAIIAHVAQADPHTQYLLKDDYEPGGGGDLDCDQCIAKHVAMPDPHEQYLKKTEAERLYLTPDEADQKYATKDDIKDLPDLATIDRDFAKKTDLDNYPTKTEVANTYVKKADLDAQYLTKVQADALYLTEAKGDARYYTKTQADARFMLKADMGDFMTETEARAIFLTPAQGDQRYLTQQVADARYLTKAVADATYALKSDLANLLTKAEANDLYGPNGSQRPVVPDATYTVKGIARFADVVTTRAGTATDYSVVPAHMKTVVTEMIDAAIANAGGGGGGGECCDPALRMFFAVYS